MTYAPTGGRGGVAVAEPVDQERESVMSFLRAGKRLLREQKPAEAFVQFEKALELARRLRDTVEEKKAARGLGKLGVMDENWETNFILITCRNAKVCSIF